MERRGRRFRRLLREEPYVFTAGVYSALDAQIAERVGLKSVYMSGYSVAMLNGWPDMGFLTMTEMTTTASMIASAVEIPVIADADDGYGNALSTMRDARNRRDPEFVLIARTDAFGAVGGSLEEAVWRGRAYADAGVDLVWCELSGSERAPAIAFAQAMRKTHPRLPLAFNYSSSFRWHQDPQPFRFQELGELGYKFIFITLFGAHASMYGVWNAMADLVQKEEEAQWALELLKKGHPTESHHEMARVPYFKELEKRFVPDAANRYRASDGFGEEKTPAGQRRRSPWLRTR